MFSNKNCVKLLAEGEEHKIILSQKKCGRTQSNTSPVCKAFYRGSAEKLKTLLHVTKIN